MPLALKVASQLLPSEHLEHQREAEVLRSAVTPAPVRPFQEWGLPRTAAHDRKMSVASR